MKERSKTLQTDEWLGSMVLLTGRFLLLLLKGIEMGLWTFDLLKEEDDQANAVEGLMFSYRILIFRLPPANAMIKPFKTAKTYNLEEMIKTRQLANSQSFGGFWSYLKLSTQQVKIWDYLCRYGYGQSWHSQGTGLWEVMAQDTLRME
ncbi:hypothetical protein BY996DRAFT_6473779, partial [Phakopsora pachyrhizi]